MNAIGIVAEYNPFHNGHEYHIKAARQASGQPDTPVVCVMSGSVTQRGELAVMSKWARAEAAVRAGASLVFELPAPYACASAEQFAGAAVYLLALTGRVGMLSFGSECGSLEPLLRLRGMMKHPDFDAECRRELATGLSYPAAIYRAAGTIAGTGIEASDAGLLASPNNMLGLCYLRALDGLGAPMTPHTVARQGAGHDHPETVAGIASASALRSRMHSRAPLDKLVPGASREIIARECAAGHAPIGLAYQERIVLSALRRMSQEDWAALSDVSEGLEARLYRAARQAVTLDALYEAAKTKRYTMARLRRIILRAYLGIPSEMLKQTPPYLRVLALNDTGAALLHDMRATVSAPIITKPASYTKLDHFARAMFELECEITDRAAFHRPSCSAAGLELRTGPVILH